MSRNRIRTGSAIPRSWRWSVSCLRSIERAGSFVGWAIVFDLYRQDDGIDWAGWRLRYATGTGLRIGTPIGPLVFDYGLNVDRVLDKLFPSRKDQRYWEALGAFHFSIGVL